MNDARSRTNGRHALWILIGVAAFVVATSMWVLRGDPATAPSLSSHVVAAAPAHAFVAESDDAAQHDERATDGVDVSAPPVARPKRAGSVAPAARSERWSGGVITGRVLGGPGASEPIAGILVRAGSPRSTFPVPPRTTRTDTAGRFEFRDLVAAHWEVDAWIAEIDRRGAASVQLDEEEQPTAELDVLLPYDRRVEVRLVDSRGDPISAESLGIDAVFLPLVCVGVARTCKTVGAVVGPADMPLNRVVDRNPKGERHTFEVVVQGAGAGCVLALFGDRVIATRSIARDEQHVEIVLDPVELARVSGTGAIEVVRASDAAPLAAARAHFHLPGADLTRDVDAQGVARLTGVPFGTLQVHVDAAGYVSRAIDVPVPSDSPVRIELVPARSLIGHLAIEGERDPARLFPAIWIVRDPRAKLGAPTQLAVQRTSPSDFRFEQLEPALYVVAAVPDSVGFLTADDVRAGRASGAVCIDLTHVERGEVRIDVPAWLGAP